MSAEDDDDDAIARELAALAAAAADLSDVPAHMRVALATPLITRALALKRGRGADVVRAILDDEECRRFVIDDLFREWLRNDPASAVHVALDYADALDTWTFSLLLARLDPLEARELALVRAQTDKSLINHIAEEPFVRGEDRLIDLALSRSGAGLEAGCVLLSRIATPRARDELIGIFDHADDDRVFHFAAFGLVRLAADEDITGLVVLVQSAKGRAYLEANSAAARVLADHGFQVLGAILNPSEEITSFVERIRTRYRRFT